jgi:hypothetical protein
MLKPIRALYIKVARALWLFCPTPRHETKNGRYSIGVVTYIRRFENLFKPLISQLCKLFPDSEIIVAVNGYYDHEQQTIYLKKINSFLEKYPNVKVLCHDRPQSLSRLWNQLIINSANAKVLIFNDDVLLLPSFRRHFENSGSLAMDVVLLKNSWSHFLIAKRVTSVAGWFDERFPGVGNEDEDYEARLALLGEPVHCIELGGLKNISVKTKDFSYGKTVEVTKEKYITANKVFFDSKWEIAEESRPGFAYVRILQNYVKLKPGMETPDFYPEIDYAKDRS